jgi:Chaperone of endosialidase
LHSAAGDGALYYNSSGSNNIALGTSAGANLTTGSNNIVIGANVLGKAGEANTTRIGKTTQAKTFIGGIYNKTVASGVGVIINSSGQLGTVQSSARYKDDIKPMDKASEPILALKPVTFRYKEELDPDHIPQVGLIAEEVEKVNPELVVRDEEGKVMTVRYEAVNAMLLNEFLKEHRRVQELEKRIQALAATVGKMRDQRRHLPQGTPEDF